jgi:hypothetical protein
MERFSKQIKVDKEPRLFVFTRMENVSGVKFFVTSVDENKNPIAFSLRRGKVDTWKLLPGSLRWLYAIEEELADAITDTQLT